MSDVLGSFSESNEPRIVDLSSAVEAVKGMIEDGHIQGIVS